MCNSHYWITLVYNEIIALRGKSVSYKLLDADFDKNIKKELAGHVETQIINYTTVICYASVITCHIRAKVEYTFYRLQDKNSLKIPSSKYKKFNFNMCKSDNIYHKRDV